MSDASSSPDPLSMATTSPIRSSQRRAPLTSRTSNYHTSPVKSMIVGPKDSQGTPFRFKVTVQAEPMLIPLNDKPSPTKRKGTPKSAAKKPTPARRRNQPAPLPVESDIPELCPVSALGDQAAADYSLSEIELPDPDNGQDTASVGNPLPTEPLPDQAPAIQDEEPEAVFGAEPGDATVLESEEFSMISVDSLPSHRNGQSSPAPPVSTVEPQSTVDHSYMPSSPPAYAMDRVTPVPSDEPQQDPQAPPPMQLHDTNVATPLRESAKMSGKALQDALNGPFRESVSREMPAPREAIFTCFGSGTRRQLRQSLYMGQNLASQSQVSSAIQNAPQLAPTRSSYLSPFHSPVRQNDLSQSRQNRLPTPETTSQTTSRSASVPTSDAQSEIEYPRLSDALQQSQLPSPSHAYDNMRSSPTHPQPIQTLSPPTSFSNVQDESASDKQAPQAEDDDRDIWQEEASRSSLHDDVEDAPAHTDLFLENLPVKPRRSKLPGTWRRTSAANFSYSDSPEPDARPIRKVSTSATQSSRKTSGVMTPPSSGDEEHARKSSKPIETAEAESDSQESGDEIGRVNTPSEVHSQVSAQDSPASGDDTGLFWQSNLPAVYIKNRQTAESTTPSSPLRNTILDISPVKPVQKSVQSFDTQLGEHVTLATNSTVPVFPSPLRKSYLRSSKLSSDVAPYTASKIDVSETQTNSSLASDVRQLQREMKQHSSNGPSTIDLTNETPSEYEESVCSSRTDFQKSYEEILNVDSPTRIKVNFNDSSGNSSLLDSKNQYPPLFDNVPALPKPSVSSPESPPRSPSVMARLTDSFWEAVTKPPVYAPQEVRRPAIVLETESTVPDQVLRLRRKYGLLSEMHPFTYAHIRTLHRMLNSSRTRSSRNIIPTSGPLGHNLSRLLGKSKTNELDQRLIWTSSHLHVVDAFMSLLLSARECVRLQAETGNWGDAEAVRHRGKDSKGRKAEDTVFEGIKGGRIEAEWVADVLADIVFKEEMNAKKKKVAEMIARAEQWERMERA